MARLERLLLEGVLDLREELDGEITFLTVTRAGELDSFPTALSLPAVLFGDPVFAGGGSPPISYASAVAIPKNLQQI
ncbi:hypothetical protein NLM33_36715 [Bradyrhizobium sp. CCGUVB1N3]|uniref:hypothetical protein n=1 Tax=Bradyrhizobium sp. CCGUVB1N3 TaxID=2949629 RepID=UPI0020B26426|nr:hypothetical protein [Bradyrhizobium sp. CCGUVB1N3]MCP3475793.1 hypothetical protein [Bradyrhizobium sp. CCGUVB1N3]